jgi:hypothetical protein
MEAQKATEAAREKEEIRAASKYSIFPYPVFQKYLI